MAYISTFAKPNFLVLGSMVFKIMTNDHMALRNQETIDAMHEWLRTFDIRNTNGQNVAVAVGKCRAVI